MDVLRSVHSDEVLKNVVELVYLVSFHLISPQTDPDTRKVWAFLFFLEEGYDFFLVAL